MKPWVRKLFLMVLLLGATLPASVTCHVPDDIANWVDDHFDFHGDGDVYVDHWWDAGYWTFDGCCW